jgi:hypothetical protein
MNNYCKIVTLSNNINYVVASTVSIDSEDYMYLISYDDFTDIMFCKVNDEFIEEVNDFKLIEKLMLEFKNKLNFEQK